MPALTNKTVVVTGGTGNVGSFIVPALLERGATVAVPSRSEKNLQELRAHLAPQLDDAALDRLRPFVGDVGSETGAVELQEQITQEISPPDAVVASLGRFVSTPSLLEASVDDLEQVVQSYLIGHFVVARTFLPDLQDRGGTYVFINGPLAFKPWKKETGLVSTVTAAQQMLFQSLTHELDGSKARVVELVTHAFIRNKQTQPTSRLPGEAVGAYASYLISGAARDVHGQSIQLRSLEQLEEAGIEIGDARSV